MRKTRCGRREVGEKDRGGTGERRGFAGLHGGETELALDEEGGERGQRETGSAENMGRG